MRVLQGQDEVVGRMASSPDPSTQVQPPFWEATVHRRRKASRREGACWILIRVGRALGAPEGKSCRTLSPKAKAHMCLAVLDQQRGLTCPPGFAGWAPGS